MRPRWRHDGKEIFYVDINGDLIGLPVKIGVDVEVGDPQRLFQIDIQEFGATGIPFADYDVSADGRRFAVVRKDRSRSINVILNWPAALGR